jgi:hypothetical protein
MIRLLLCLGHGRYSRLSEFSIAKCEAAITGVNYALHGAGGDNESTRGDCSNVERLHTELGVS